jgi:hypothetical protein
MEEPNYAKPLGEIYKELFINLISWKHGLNLLLDSGLPGLEDVPTWVPDWSNSTDRNWLDSCYLYPREGRTATCGSQATWKLLQNSSVLRVRGCWQGHTVFRSKQLRKITEMSFDLDDVECRQAYLWNIESMLDFLHALLNRALVYFPESSIPTMLYEITHVKNSARIESSRRTNFDHWYQFLLRFTSSTAEKSTRAERLLDALLHDALAMRSYKGI